MGDNLPFVRYSANEPIDETLDIVIDVIEEHLLVVRHGCAEFVGVGGLRVGISSLEKLTRE
jgi:hypothetical protein